MYKTLPPVKVSLAAETIAAACAETQWKYNLKLHIKISVKFMMNVIKVRIIFSSMDLDKTEKILANNKKKIISKLIVQFRVPYDRRIKEVKTHLLQA